MCDGVLQYSDRVDIPKALQIRMKDFHIGYSGIKRIITLMCSYVYWPIMDKDIKNMVDSCKGCVLTAKTPPITFKL